MQQPSEQQIAKLPKWAQENIADLQRQRDVAVRQLNEYCDNQTPAPFYYDEMVCTGEEVGPTTKRRYVSAYRMTVEHAGITLDVTAFDGGCIKLSWGLAGRHISDRVAFVPTSYMQAELHASCGREVRDAAAKQ